MPRHKISRDKGRFSFMRFFQKFQPGDVVAVVRELSQPFGYEKRIQGRTGKVIEKRGSAYYVEIKELNKLKKYLIRPIHLKRIENLGTKSPVAGTLPRTYSARNPQEVVSGRKVAGTLPRTYSARNPQEVCRK